MSDQSLSTDSTSSPPTAASLTLVWLTLGLCLALTAMGFRFAVAIDERETAKHLESSVGAVTTASSDTTYMLPLLGELMTVFTAVQQDVATGIPMTTRRLQSHLWVKPPLGLETTGLQLLPRVPAGEADSRQLARALLGANSSDAAAPMLQSNGAKTLAKLAPAEDYFPILVQAGPDITAEPIGLDRTNQPLFQLAMHMARDTGFLASYSSFPLSNSDKEFFVTVYYYPLYRSGKIPTTVDERRRQLMGFASAYTRTPAKGVFDFLPQSYHGMEAAFIPQLPKTLEGFDARLVRFLKSDAIKRGDYQSMGLKFSIIIAASPALRGSIASSTRWWVLGLGLLATCWMQSMLLWARYQSRKIVALVNERTRDLSNRTAELTKANQALLQSEGRYRVLADNVSDVIYTCDDNGICTYISPSITDHTGHLPEELLGKPIADIIHAETAKPAVDTPGPALEEPGHPDLHGTHEVALLCKDGPSKFFEASIGRLLDEHGKAVGTLGVMRDISERKHAEHEKELLQQAYQQAQKMEAIGTLAGGVAHDFNNLMTGVLGHAEMLKHELHGNIDSVRSIGLIEMAATRAKDLTSQLLGFARKGKFVQVPVDIHKTISDMVGLLEHTVDKNITITRINSGRSPVVLGDPGQISQIFLNLAVNARDAMPSGGSLTFKTEILSLDQLSAKASFGLEPGNYCAVSVSDTGIGIAKDKLERIFEPFFTDKEEGKGTGLGLAMVYGVVKNHKGAVRVYSEVGAGTVFKIFLPLHEGAGGASQPAPPTSPTRGTGKLLLIDDQQLVRQVCEVMLRKLGYEVVTCADGDEGLEYYSSHWQSIDVVLTDMIMPKMGGLDCLAEMKKINPALKGILCTGYSREDIAEQVKESHILGFIQKPYRLNELSEVVARVNQH